jgi:hypothetical protein
VFFGRKTKTKKKLVSTFFFFAVFVWDMPTRRDKTRKHARKVVPPSNYIVLSVYYTTTILSGV